MVHLISYLLQTVQGGSKAGDAPIVQDTFTGAYNQDWCFVPAAVQGHYVIRNRNSGLIIHGKFEPNVENSGFPVYQAWYWGGKMQQWRVDIEGPAPLANKTADECVGFPMNTFVHIQARHSGKVIGVDPAQIAEVGAAVTQNPANPGPHDNWSFKATGNGNYHVFNQASGLALSRT
jgi:Ricin-type beta-trefoil lectin domain-like